MARMLKLILAIPLAVSAATAPSAMAQPAAIEFNRDIRPILSDNCFTCHGPDTAQRKAGLRLDTEKGAFADLGGYSAIVRGKPHDSELWKRLVTTDPDDIMPPAKTGKGLTPAQKDLLRRWIASGARYQLHWSYIPPAPPPVPAAEAPNPIDRFIGARLAREGLTAAPEADRTTLARRLYFDLLGLPPTPAEVDAFVSDTRPDAYERLVSKLLASPHYGERMAVYWLDLVRYADSIGYHSDLERSVSPYRDYVIAAFNGNKPFDRFTVEQLAGDLLPGRSQEARVASTYNMLLLSTEEGGAQPKEYEAKNAADRVRNVSSVWMGATVACAQCHDHKYDPYSLKDFYRMAAFFADIKEEPISTRKASERLLVATPAQASTLKKADLALDRLTWQLEEPSPARQAAIDAWEARTREVLAQAQRPWTVVTIEEATSERGASFEAPGKTLRALGGVPETDVYTLKIPADEPGLTGLRLEAIASSQHPNAGLSRGNGNIVVTELTVSLLPAGETTPRPVKLRAAVADYEQEGFPASAAIDGKPGTGWAVDGDKIPVTRRLIVTFAQPLSAGAGAKLVVRVEQGYEKIPRAALGRFSVATTTLARPDIEGRVPDEVVTTFNKDPLERTKEETLTLRRHWAVFVADGGKRRRAFQQLTLARWKVVRSIPTTLHTLPLQEARLVRVLPRGNWQDESGEPVAPGVPEFMGTLPGRPTRLDLARWLVDGKNPLTARVLVNRLWKLYFGTGLSKVLDDLGSQGEWPSHPELLDWLATELVRSRWDLKHMVRLMVTSQTYRQSTVAPRELRARDPYNRLLARQTPFRLDAEFVRDNALAVSGLLSRELGGRSVKPYQPEGYWDQLNFPSRVWVADRGLQVYRRGLYTHWQRTFLHPSLLAFDAPSREECTADRARSNTPQQALTLLNDPTYVEAARVFAARILREGGANEEQRLIWAFRQATSRSPTAAERALLADLRRKHLGLYDADKGAARALVSVGQAAARREVDPAELASWTSVSRALLNLHETITRN